MRLVLFPHAEERQQEPPVAETPECVQTIMKAHAVVPLVDTNIIPDRNAGIGSLLWDLQHPQEPDRDRPPLLQPAFAFIDVGVSRAKVATALHTLLARDLGMDVTYVATERPEAVPYAHVTPLGDGAETIRRCLSSLISSARATREVTDWHYVIDRQGTVSSVAYSYNLLGNEIWEAYFMGRTFMYGGELVEFSDPRLDKTLRRDALELEARIDLERARDRDRSRPGPSWDGYRMERNPLEAGLAGFGITLQRTDVPRRIEGRQNVLFLGNVLNHYPQDQQAGELDRIAANLEAWDLVIIQVDETETPSIEVLQVTRHGARTTRERVRWIDTRKLEIQVSVRGAGSWRHIYLEPCVERLVGRLTDCLGLKVNAPYWRQGNRQALVRQCVRQVLRTFFRALPVEETLRIAIREVVRRLPPEVGPKGVPVFEGDARDVHGGPLVQDASPIVPETDFRHLA